MKDTTCKMSNEELCMVIKAGDEGYLPQLWEQVRRLIAQKARRFYNNLDNKHGVEVDDLIQSGYFAVLEAVKYFEPQAGYKFNTFLNNTLKSSFAETAGIRSSKRNALDYSISLDVPIGEEDGDLTLLDTIQDMTAEDAYYDVVEDVYNYELRRLLNIAMDGLNDSVRRRITMHFFFNMTYQEIADIQGVSKVTIEQRVDSALRKMYFKICNTHLIEFFYGTYRYKMLKGSRARCERLVKAIESQNAQSGEEFL